MKDDDANAAAAAAAVASVLGVNAETPRFDGSDPSSPALSLIGMPGQGQGQFVSQRVFDGECRRLIEIVRT